MRVFPITSSYILVKESAYMLLPAPELHYRHPKIPVIPELYLEVSSSMNCFPPVTLDKLVFKLAEQQATNCELPGEALPLEVVVLLVLDPSCLEVVPLLTGFVKSHSRP